MRNNDKTKARAEEREKNIGWIKRLFTAWRVSHAERTERRAEWKEAGEDEPEEDETPVVIPSSAVTMHPKGTPALSPTSSVEVEVISVRTDGNTPLLCLTLAMASLGVSWAGRLRVRHSHDGLASGRASETRGCPLAGRDLHGNPLHTDLCFWRLLLALCAIATPEAVLGECVAVLLRQWIEPRRRLHR